MKRVCCVFWVGKCLGSNRLRPRPPFFCKAGRPWLGFSGTGRILGPESTPFIHAYRSPSGQCPVGAWFSAHLLPQVPLLWGIEQPPDAHMRYPHQSSDLSVKLKLTSRISMRQTLRARERVPEPPEGCFGDSLNCFAPDAFKAPSQQLRILLFTATLSSPPTPWSLAGRQSQQRVTDVHGLLCGSPAGRIKAVQKAALPTTLDSQPP